MGRAQWGQLGNQMEQIEGWGWNLLKAHSLTYLGLNPGETKTAGARTFGVPWASFFFYVASLDSPAWQLQGSQTSYMSAQGSPGVCSKKKLSL